MMYLAKELHKSLDELMEISTAELVLWAAFYKMEGEKETARQNARMRNGRKYSR